MYSKQTKLLLIVLAFFFGSCSKDEDGLKNYFIYDGKTYSLKTAYIRHHETPEISAETGEEFWINDLIIVGPSINHSEGEFTGIGDFVVIGLGLPGNTLVEGTYDWQLESDWSSGGLLGASAGVNYNVGTNEGTSHYFSGGKVVVTHSGSLFMLEIDGIADGKSVTGRFKGVFSELN